MKKSVFIVLLGISALVLVWDAGVAKDKKKNHPFDVFTEEIHQMHSEGFFTGVISCETCHVTDDSYERGAHKVNRTGCHLCHNPAPGQKPRLEAPKTCNLCHVGGQFPKPQTHQTNWLAKHQIYAKQDPQSCTQCHSNQMFCLDCHKKRETSQQRVHRRNFRSFHSIEARANPRRCDACHTVNYCQECHSGRGSSKR